MGKKKQASQWTPAHLRILEQIIEDDPDLYLDKIQYVFWELGQGYGSRASSNFTEPCFFLILFLMRVIVQNTK